MGEVVSMQISGTLAKLRKESGLSQTQVAEYIKEHGIALTQRAVSKWERGDTLPNAEQFLLLCQLYQVRDVLTEFCGQAGLYEKLNALGKKRIKEYARLLELDKEFNNYPSFEQPHLLTRTLPLYDLPVSAGTGQFLDSENYELIEVDETVPLSATFAVKISGDSMTPRFVDQQIVYIKQQQTLERGECGIFILNGNAYCKQLAGQRDTRLVSFNSQYEPIIIEEYDEFKVLGKVVS